MIDLDSLNDKYYYSFKSDDIRKDFRDKLKSEILEEFHKLPDNKKTRIYDVISGANIFELKEYDYSKPKCLCECAIELTEYLGTECILTDPQIKNKVNCRLQTSKEVQLDIDEMRMLKAVRCHCRLSVIFYYGGYLDWPQLLAPKYVW